jgi:hypothetical protein
MGIPATRISGMNREAPVRDLAAKIEEAKKAPPH